MNQVVCIADEWGPPSAIPDAPVPAFAPHRGDVLTVRRVEDGCYFFQELPETYELPGGRRGTISWPVEAFRPIKTIEQDIAIFAPLLDQPELEPA